MSINDNIPKLERLAFFEGQRLTAEDLEAIQDYGRQMRWLHNRSLHTWGIVFGLDVTAQRGDRQLAIQPGLAIDSLGREILLNSPSLLPIPPLAGDSAGAPAGRYLTISYIEDGDLPAGETAAGLCDTSGAIRKTENALLRFQAHGETDPQIAFRPGLDVILASIQIQNCKLAAVPSPKERRDARPASLPYIVSGMTPLSATPWTNIELAGVNAGIQVKVDTSASGFGSTPVYLAEVVGERLIEGNFLDGLTSITQASALGFTLQMLFPNTPPKWEDTGLYCGATPLNPLSKFIDLAATVSQQKWYVIWMGIEE